MEFDQSKLFPLCVGILVVILPFVIIIYAKIRDKRREQQEENNPNEPLKFDFNLNQENGDEK